MVGGSLKFDPATRVLAAEGHVIVDHIDSAPAVDSAMLALLRNGRTTVRIEQNASGQWNIFYLTALPDHHQKLADIKRNDQRQRQHRHEKSLADQEAQKVENAKAARRKERADAGLPPEEVEAPAA